MLGALASRAVTSAASRVSPTALATRGFAHSTWISGFPRTRIPFAEKVAHGVVITIAGISFPTWVLCHLQEYKK